MGTAEGKTRYGESPEPIPGGFQGSKAPGLVFLRSASFYFSFSPFLSGASPPGPWGFGGSGERGVPGGRAGAVCSAGSQRHMGIVIPLSAGKTGKAAGPGRLLQGRELMAPRLGGGGGGGGGWGRGKRAKSRRVQLWSRVFPQGGWEERKGRGVGGVVPAPQTNRGFKSKCLHSPSPPKNAAESRRGF